MRVATRALQRGENNLDLDVELFDGERVYGFSVYTDQFTGEPACAVLIGDALDTVEAVLPKGVIPYDENSNTAAYQAWINERQNLPG